MIGFGKRDAKHNALHDMQIATPCSMPWENMIGDERSRYCDSCKLSVYNISELTLDEAGALIAENEGGICGRIYRRADGTVITKDCPVGVRKVLQRAVTLYGSIGAVAAALITWFLGLEPVSTQATEVPAVAPAAVVPAAPQQYGVVGRLQAPSAWSGTQHKPPRHDRGQK